ncbi:MAG: hypothetical protein ACREF3_21365, partial [Acetobacteraceae bacterium]
TQSLGTFGPQVSCTSPQNTGLQMMAYPLTEGRVGLDSRRYKGNSPGQLILDRGDFPPGNFDVRVDCTTAQGVTSSLTVPSSQLEGLPCRPWGVGQLIKAQDGAEIDVVAPECRRRPIPNTATLDGIKYSWASVVRVVTPDQFNDLHRGLDIPDLTTNAYQFTLAMDAIYGARCFSLQLPIGTLIRFVGDDRVWVLSGGCTFRYIPNLTTLQAIESRYNLTVQDLPLFPPTVVYFYNGPYISDYTTNRDGFEHDMQEIYGP